LQTGRDGCRATAASPLCLCRSASWLRS
jgi:hypothetical protein